MSSLMLFQCSSAPSQLDVTSPGIALKCILSFRKGNVDTHSVWVPGIGKVKDADLGLCQDASGTNKGGVAEWDRGPR